MTEQIIEFELAEDVQEFIVLNPDVTYEEPSIKNLIQQADPSALLKVEKTIDSPTKFVSVIIADDAFFENL